MNRVIQASRLMIAEFLEVTFSRHGTCKLLYDTSLALARSSPTRRYTGYYERASERAERVFSYLREKSEYSRPGPARPGPTPSRSLKSYISGTACLIDKRSSLLNTTWMLKLYGMITILRQYRSWRVAHAKLGVLWATPKTLYLNNRTTAGPIGLRLGIQLGTQQTIHVCGSCLGCFSTCARAHPVSTSRERLNRLR